MIRSGSCLNFCKAHPEPHVSVPMIVFFLHSCDTSKFVCVVLDVKNISVELGRFLLSAPGARRDDKRNPFQLTQSHCTLLRHLLFRPLVETSPNFLEGLLRDLHFLQVGPALKWILGPHDLFHKVLLFH